MSSFLLMGFIPAEPRWLLDRLPSSTNRQSTA
jgi:hypothetical protein